MAQYQCDVFIDAPVDQVFAASADIHSWTDRISGITGVELLTDGPFAKGTKFKETRKMFGKDCTEEMEVTAFEQNKLYELSALSCNANFVSEMRFDPEGSGTRMTITMNCSPQTFGAKLMSAIMSPFMKGMMLKCVRQDMDDLKASIEGAPPSGAATPA